MEGQGDVVDAVDKRNQPPYFILPKTPVIPAVDPGKSME
jgi:hypothetical protein